MNDRYIAFDVETPNYANNRMSAIGVSVVEGGEIVDEVYSLVNPEARSLDHHCADSDSRACAKILLHCLDEGADIRPFKRTYDLRRLCAAKRYGTGEKTC